MHRGSLGEDFSPLAWCFLWGSLFLGNCQWSNILLALWEDAYRCRLSLLLWEICLFIWSGVSFVLLRDFPGEIFWKQHDTSVKWFKNFWRCVLAIFRAAGRFQGFKVGSEGELPLPRMFQPLGCWDCRQMPGVPALWSSFSFTYMKSFAQGATWFPNWQLSDSSLLPCLSWKTINPNNHLAYP